MVNTFIPYSNVKRIAKVLDSKRLGKQRVEAKQILSVIEKLKSGQKNIAWGNHPAVLMWFDHTDALKYYYNTIVREWMRRGYVNNMPLFDIGAVEMPWFVKNKHINYSHQASLMRKDPKYYTMFNPPEQFMEYSYIWPSKVDKRKLNKKVININDFAIKLSH